MGINFSVKSRTRRLTPNYLGGIKHRISARYVEDATRVLSPR